MPDPRLLLFGYLLLMSLILFAFMGADKQRAKRRAWRVPERTLFWLAALGGGLGGVLGMLAFRHKTRHASFCIGMPLLMLFNFAAAYLLLRYVI
ncbi:MAG: DUF1294 domain-containing protein [bacterium]|nr:DUF1294 domain-containing protein [bacterium]